MRARIAQYLRRLRDGLHESFTEEYSPQEVSGSFAIGVFITMLPTLGAGLLVFVLLSYLSERINKVALFASVLVVNPAVKWGVYAASFTLGVFLLGPVDEPGQIEFSLDVGREDLVVATKGGLLRNTDTDWLPHGDPDYLRNAYLCSRDRLGVDTIDLYQLHRPDPDTPFEDSVHALAELKDAGLVEHVGLSNVSVDQLDRARDIVEIATVQNQYNVANRDAQAVLEACENDDIGFIPWFPLAAGELDGVSDIDAIAERHDATPYQIALAWLLQSSEVTLPIPGTASLEHLEQNVAAADIDLDDDELARLT